MVAIGLRVTEQPGKLPYIFIQLRKFVTIVIRMRNRTTIKSVRNSLFQVLDKFNVSRFDTIFLNFALVIAPDLSLISKLFNYWSQN